MNRSRTFIGAAALLLSAGLTLSACAAAPGYDATAYPYVYNGYAEYPDYDTLGFGFGGYPYFHDDRVFNHGHHGAFVRHFGHGSGRSFGHGFGHFGGHGFAARGGFGGHGGGGHR
jgi:hypothetical protein